MRNEILVMQFGMTGCLKYDKNVEKEFEYTTAPQNLKNIQEERLIAVKIIRRKNN
jgi:hypothetical protein